MSAMHAPRSLTLARSARITALAVPAAVSLALLTGTAAVVSVGLTKVSHDIYTDPQAQHRTEVEPDTFQAGATIVSAFQVGRVFGGGAANIGWATSTNGGATWSHGYLPGITHNGSGHFGQGSDAAVAYDAKHKVWLIASLGLNLPTVDVLASRSTNGGRTWGKPVTVATGGNDKSWIVCDNTAASPQYGNCYTEWDNTNAGELLSMSTSSNGGVSWGPARSPGGNDRGVGGQPLVLPNGDVVVPYLSNSGQIRSFRSTDGGASWGSSVLVSGVRESAVRGGLRAPDLPSAAVDAAGTVYVAWSDCRFRAGCHSNDIVIAKSANGTTWAAPVRVPVDATSSTVDHFIPGLDADRSTAGSNARIGLTYYYYPKAACGSSACQLDAGFISSVNGGASWSAPAQLAGPMKLSWLANTSQGRMFGDYISTSVLPGGNAYPVISVATAPSGATFNQAMYVPTGGLAITGGSRAASAAHAYHVTRGAGRPTVPLTVR